VVESQPFFNSKEYRAELKSKILPWEGDGKTHVILHGFNHGSWEVADAIRQVCANYPALTCRLNGQAIQVSAILSTALEVGRVGLTRVLYQRGHEYRTCFWHGHKIVRPALGQVKVVNRLGEFIVDNTSMVLDIRDENRITPQLPARDYVVMDERTTSFLAEAAKVFAEGLVNAAIAKAEHLSHQSKVTPDDLRELADICRPITGGHQIMLHADWKNFETLKFKEDDGATVVVKAMRRSKIRGCFDEFLVVTPTYTEDFEIGECGSFSMNEGEDDYLAANNYVHSSAYDNKVYPCIVTRDDFDADGVNVIGAYELRVVAAKDVEPLLRTEDYHAIWELVAKAEVLIDAEDNVDLAVMLHRSSDPETDLPTKFITTDFGHARSLWSSIYLGYQRHHNDGEYGPSEVETECENHWDDLQAELDGEIRLPISKYTLQSKLGIRTGVPVVFDFEKNTATVGEKVMKLAW
jgi:hypothetical protein